MIHILHLRKLIIPGKPILYAKIYGILQMKINLLSTLYAYDFKWLFLQINRWYYLIGSFILHQCY